MAQQLGAEVREMNNTKFVSLRTGFICETAGEHRLGFYPASTTSKDKKVNNFFAKNYNGITGYVADIRWYTKEFKEGGSMHGWNIRIDTTTEEYLLFVSVKDRPYDRLMSVLCNIKFDEPVGFKAFKGKDGKVLLLYQGDNTKPVQPKLQSRWLRRSLINKLKANAASVKKGEAPIPLTTDEQKDMERNLVVKPDQTIDWDFPYIIQNADGKTWSFDAWHNFLIEQMNDTVIPQVKMANDVRKQIKAEALAMEHYIPADDETPEFSGPPIEATDDDIPF